MSTYAAHVAAFSLGTEKWDKPEIGVRTGGLAAFARRGLGVGGGLLAGLAQAASALCRRRF